MYECGSGYGIAAESFCENSNKSSGIPAEYEVLSASKERFATCTLFVILELGL